MTIIDLQELKNIVLLLESAGFDNVVCCNGKLFANNNQKTGYTGQVDVISGSYHLFGPGGCIIKTGKADMSTSDSLYCSIFAD